MRVQTDPAPCLAIRTLFAKADHEESPKGQTHRVKITARGILARITDSNQAWQSTRIPTDEPVRLSKPWGDNRPPYSESYGSEFRERAVGGTKKGPRLPPGKAGLGIHSASYSYPKNASSLDEIGQSRIRENGCSENSSIASESSALLPRTVTSGGCPRDRPPSGLYSHSIVAGGLEEMS
jgi:hypothetical protein